jgi:putative ABC transport system permease protein
MADRSFLRILWFPTVEGLRMAMFSLWSNRLRTFLSLLGISIGIFTVITVFTLVDSWELKFRNSLSNLGNEVVYVEKWPWAFNSEYPWWKYMSRPQPSYREFQELQRRSSGKADVALFVDFELERLQGGREELSKIKALAVSQLYPELREFELENGRFFQPSESAGGSRVVLLGSGIAEELFGSADKALDKKVRCLGQRATVIGVIRKEGNNPINTSLDEAILLPVNWLRKVKGQSFEDFYPLLMAKPRGTIPFEEFKAELRGKMRAIRRLSPRREDNFALNQLSLLANQLQATFATIGIIGWIVGGFSLLVGGFGIANIMFVSVYERTPQIGVQMALGSRRSFVILQFLLESVVLSLLGGIIGLVAVGLLVLVLNAIMDLNLTLMWHNVLNAAVISSIIGLVAGIWPAMRAGDMDPVEAMRQV